MELNEIIWVATVLVLGLVSLAWAEIEKRRESLTNFETQIAELEKHKADFEGKIKDHLDNAIQYEKEIEKLAESKEPTDENSAFGCSWRW